MATLYIRDVPPELHEKLRAWARRSGRSVNAEVIDLLEREAARRPAQELDWFAALLALRERINLSDEAAEMAIASIRAHRDAGL